MPYQVLEEQRDVPRVQIAQLPQSLIVDPALDQGGGYGEAPVLLQLEESTAVTPIELGERRLRQEALHGQHELGAIGPVLLAWPRERPETVDSPR